MKFYQNQGGEGTESIVERFRKAGTAVNLDAVFSPPKICHQQKDFKDENVSLGMNGGKLYESRRDQKPYKKSAETGSYIIPFQTYLWERRTLGRPNCQEVC